MPTTTTNLSLYKPTVGGDTDAWGGYLNDNFDDLDAIFKDDGTGTSVGLNVGSGKTLSVGGTFKVDTISEKTSAAGVTIDGVLLKDAAVSTDTISEKTAATGVTADGTLLKDGGVGVSAAGSASTPIIYKTDDANTGVFFPTADTLSIATGGSERVRFDATGNVGIGVTPASKTNYRAIEFSSGGVSWSGNTALNLLQNAYTDSSDAEKYKQTYAASKFMQDTGAHIFYTAASGTADTAITWSERVRIANDGRVTVKKASNAEITALSDGATITPDFSAANNFSVTLAGNRTLANPTNITAGQSGVIVITQDGSGSKTLAYGSYWKFPGGTAPTLTTTASAVDVLAYYVESTTRITARLVNDTK